ncbi:class E sortase [Streptomyces buecherae]|uniref:class E sortase n=1 Tax=Streptomyces buecherae TaxID=2763006 RepID=UPI0037B5601C
MTALRPDRAAAAPRPGPSDSTAPADPTATTGAGATDTAARDTVARGTTAPGTTTPGTAAPGAGRPAAGRPSNEETVGLRVPGLVRRGAPGPGPMPPLVDAETMALRQARPPRRGEFPLPPERPRPSAGDAPGGRAARRKAARKAAGRAGRRAAARRAPGAARAGPPAVANAGAATGPAAPTTRLAARRAERARRPGVATMVSRGLGELFITIGVLMLLFVAYQLWWTNIIAQQQAREEREKLQKQWAQDDRRAPGEFEPGEGFAIMYIPKLDVVVPVAEGIDKRNVLDRGMVGHYGTGKLSTAMPSDKRGNFAVAGHRNTHGEPFRYINRLQPGDPIVVETQDAYYTYEMAAILPETSPSNIGVIGPVPPGSGFTGPGRYLTMTTCTPEFTSKYRMIVWGKMVEERPRSQGKPDPLVK